MVDCEWLKRGCNSVIVQWLELGRGNMARGLRGLLPLKVYPRLRAGFCLGGGSMVNRRFFLNREAIGGFIGEADGRFTIENCGWFPIRNCGGLIASQWGGCLGVANG